MASLADVFVWAAPWSPPRCPRRPTAPSGTPTGTPAGCWPPRSAPPVAGGDRSISGRWEAFFSEKWMCKWVWFQCSAVRLTRSLQLLTENYWVVNWQDLDTKVVFLWKVYSVQGFPSAPRPRFCVSNTEIWLSLPDSAWTGRMGIAAWRQLRKTQI